MADFKFACPGCGQHIVCDEAWGGQQLQCPACQCQLIVPQTQQTAAPQVAPLLPPFQGTAGPPPSLVPTPPASVQPRLGTAKPTSQPSAGTRAAGAPPVPATKFTPPPIRKPGEGEKKGGVKKILTIASCVVVFCVAGYFGFIWVGKMQDKANEKRREIERNSDGGEMGHIANLYDVLDATEPGGRGLGGGSRSSGPRSRQTTGTREIGVPGESYKTPMQVNQAMQVVPASFTLEADSAKIPDGRVNGMITGTNFVLDIARLDPVGTAYVLSLRQGTNMSPDREILVYLHLKAGEKISGHTWTITKDMKDKTVPQVAKRWKVNPKFAPLQKSFANGYAMKLEFGKIEEEEVSGKIFIALPDPEQSFAAGNFRADTSIFEMPGQEAASPMSSPTNAAVPPAKPIAPTAPAGKTAMRKH